MRSRSLPGAFVVLLSAGASSLALAQGGPPPPTPLPPVPVPSANAITEEKRLLGKILFWDEQLSGDSTVACGTCHSNGRSGTDGRIAINPGPDAVFATPDDVRGSPGVVHADVHGNPVQDPVYGFNVQVTRRSANAAIGAAYSPELFWDGRARTTFFNPETGNVSIATGGALENQAIGPVLSTVEMGCDQRTWSHVAAKLARSEPLGYATQIPADLVTTVSSHKSYKDLFQEAFGDPAITAERIAFAIATYERTLVADQTPFDRFAAGVPGALSAAQLRGWNFFAGSRCATCHTPPTFTDHSYRNIGVRPPEEDTGRKEVTSLEQDRGKFKTPTLRGVGLKATFMHNGVYSTLLQVIDHYRPGNFQIFLDNIDPLMPVPVPPNLQADLVDFMANALTDQRVATQTFPFDQPTLQAGNLPKLLFDADKATMTWPALQGVASYVVYRGDLADLVDVDLDGLPDNGYGVCTDGTDPNTSDTVYVDTEVPLEGRGFFYVKGVRDGTAERGLGVTSAAKPRIPGVPCP